MNGMKYGDISPKVAAYSAMRMMGSQYTPHLYQPGDVVRWRDKWGVCVGYKVAAVPYWEWYTENGSYIDSIGSVSSEMSTAYDLAHPGIPDIVATRAIASRLADGLLA